MKCNAFSDSYGGLCAPGRRSLFCRSQVEMTGEYRANDLDSKWDLQLAEAYEGTL